MNLNKRRKKLLFLHHQARPLTSSMLQLFGGIIVSLIVLSSLPKEVSGLSSSISSTATTTTTTTTTRPSATTTTATTTTTTTDSSIEKLERIIENQNEQEQDHHLLHSFIDDNNGGERHCEIGLISNKYYGCRRGLVATKDLNPNDLVLKIPMKCINIQTTVTNTNNNKAEEEEEDDDEEVVDSWAGRLASQLMALDDNNCDVYKQSLPVPPSVPTSWSNMDDLLDEFQNPDFVDLIRKEKQWKKQTQQKQQQQILTTIGASSSSNEKEQTSNTFMDCLDLVCSRTIRTGNTFQLVPLLDMANHACQKQGGGYYKLVNDVLQDDGKQYSYIGLYAGERGLKQGQEVTLDYGCRSNEDWILHYGFLPHRNTDGEQIVLPNNKATTVTWDDVVVVPTTTNNRRRRRLSMNENDLRQECLDLLHNHPTSLDDDIQLLKENPGLDYRYQMAINYRISRKILLSAIAGVTDRVASPSSFSFL